VIELSSKAKGLSRSQFAKTTVFTHINAHPPKGVWTQISGKDAAERQSDAARGKPGEIRYYGNKKELAAALNKENE